MNIELLISNIAFITTLLISFGMGVLVYIRRPKENGSINLIFLLTVIAFCIWQISYVVGVNLVDPLWSRFSFMFNLVALFINIINAHLILIMTNRFEGQKRLITFLYSITTVLVISFILNPDLLLLPSRPQLYLPNFLVMGPFYMVQDVLFIITLAYLLIQVGISYHKVDIQIQNRLKYFIAGLLYVNIIALIPKLLLYNITVDPLLTSMSGLYTIPLAYAILKYDVININLIAKRTFICALGTAGIASFISFIGYANNAISIAIPGFPQWLLPLLSGLLGVAVGFFVWKKIQEVDYLKFQFVDVVTHKFRTPLTHIKWSAEVLRSEDDQNERAKAITTIEDANSRLFEMTNSLVGLSRADESLYKYVYTSENLVEMLNEAMAAIENQIRTKKIKINLHVDENMPNIFVDRRRVQFVIQMILENAIIYSRQGSRVDINVEQRKAFAYISVHDTGIGISPEDMPHLFSRFFRAANAAETHTEGLGIGLYVSHDIMVRHGGDLWAESAGKGKGSTFHVKIPLEK